MSLGIRLREERERLGLSQPKFAAIANTTNQTLFSWESGKTAPDGFQIAAFAAAGVDVLYVLTGERDGPAPVTLTAEEETMLSYFREASKEVRRAALGALLGASAPASAARKASSSTSTGEQIFHSQVGQAVKVSGNLDQSGISFFSNKKDKK